MIDGLPEGKCHIPAGPGVRGLSIRSLGARCASFSLSTALPGVVLLSAWPICSGHDDQGRLGVTWPIGLPPPARSGRHPARTAARSPPRRTLDASSRRRMAGKVVGVIIAVSVSRVTPYKARHARPCHGCPTIVL